MNDLSDTAKPSESRSTKISPAVILDKVALCSGSVARLQKIDLKIPQGRTAIVGHSGAGKSSLLSLIAQFEYASSGQVNLGSMATHCNMPLFWAPQDNGLWPHLTVRQHLTAVASQETNTANPFQANDVLEPDSTAAEETQTSIDKSLHAFDLIHRQSAYPDQLSRGEQNRLAVLRCLFANPALILLDEPLIHVDPKRQPKYWNLIENHVKGNRISLIFATHQPEIAIAHSDHCLCLNQGSVDWFGPTQQLYNAAPNQQLAEYLGPNNWFENHEARAIFGRECEFLSCRPEQLRLLKCESSALEIIGTTFSGSYAMTELRHTSGQLQKEVIHRPQANVFEVGQFVTLETVVS